MKELLAPAGDLKSLKAAIHGGADAIYVGMQLFGARKYATNFTEEEIIEAIDLCHLYGVRLYVTMNTMIKDHEVSSFLKQVDFLYHNGIDAFILQDFGLICLLLDIYEDIEIHASTQFNNSTINTIKLLKDLGVKRVVLSRELSLDEINKIDIDIEKEVFIHGALCISYSGNCLFSSMLGNRSGNRGECTACCRLPYKLYKNNQKINSGYLLSTKELNTSPNFKSLLNSNIQSFKIEGRMKSPEYVYFITKFYRNIIDNKTYQNQDLETLKILFNREFTTGTLFNDNLINPKSPNHLGLKIGKVISITKSKIKIKLNRIIYQEDGLRFAQSKKGTIVNFLYNDKDLLVNSCNNICSIKNTINLTSLDDVYLTSSKHLSKDLLNYPLKKIPLNISFKASTGKKCLLEISDGNNSVNSFGPICSKAKNTHITKESIEHQLSKLGNTIYQSENITIDISPDIFIPLSSINDLRRTCITKLNQLRTTYKRKSKKKITFPKLEIKTTNYKTIIVDNEQELLKCLPDYKRIYTKSIQLFNKYQQNKSIYYIEKRNCFNNIPIKRSLVGEYSYTNNSISDYSFNVANIYSVYYLLKLGYSCVTLSVELTNSEISSLLTNFEKTFKFKPNIEIICQDRIELMLIKGNVLELIPNKEYLLIDPKKRNYPTYFDGVNTHILHYQIFKIENNCSCNKRYHYKYLK